MKETLGIAAAIVGIAAGVPYIIGIFKGSIRPHRVSWAIWATLGTITLTSYLAKGAHWSAMLALAATFNNLVIFLISLKYGVGGTTKREKLALAIGLLGVLIWAVTRQASFALLLAIGADAIGTVLTVQKSYKKPNSESALTWSMASIASLCGLLAVKSYTLAQTIYPVYALAGGCSIALVTISRRHIRAKGS